MSSSAVSTCSNQQRRSPTSKSATWATMNPPPPTPGPCCCTARGLARDSPSSPLATCPTVT
jgi:hypothetical protein